MEHVMHMDFPELWQSELRELLTRLSTERHHTSRQQKLHFRLQNCIEVCQETNRLSYMALPSNVIINIPIVASVVSDVPLDKENPFFEIEVLTMSEQGTIVVGVVDQEFEAGFQPGLSKYSFGFIVADGSVQNGLDVKYDRNAICCVGDKVGCGIDFTDENQLRIYFTSNGNRLEVFDFPFLNAKIPLYPAISMTTPREEVRLIQDTPWRSSRPYDQHGCLKLCRETGQLSFRSTKKGGRDATILANLPFSKQFAYFEIEIRALGPEDEVSIGGVPEDYSLRKLPGTRSRSLGYHAHVGGIFPGINIKRDDAPKCQVGDKMGCGIDHRANGKRHLYFTHNSKSFMEAELNENCPMNLYPAIGMHSRGSTVCVCLLECSKWGSTDDDIDTKPMQVDMMSQVCPEPGDVLVDKEIARASFSSPVGVAKDAVLVSSICLTTDNCSYFEIEILYGNVITIGLVPKDISLTVHPGWTENSIGYNADSGQVYSNSQVIKAKQSKSTYGDRIGCGLMQNPSNHNSFLVYFNKNGTMICELEFGDDTSSFCPAIGMRSAGQVLAVRLLDRFLWSCHEVAPRSSKTDPGSQELLNRELLDRELICPICRDIFTNPRIMPCSVHTFCSDCLKTYIEQYHGKRSVPCPLCQKLCVVPGGGVSELPKNPLITRLLEIRSKMEGN